MRFFTPRLKNQPPQSRLRLSEGGWTIVELMLVMAIMSVISVTVTILYTKLSQGMAADEMHTQLQVGNQAMLNRIHVRMGPSHHFFFNDNASGGMSFVSRLSFSNSVTVNGGGTYTFTAPASITTTTLCQAQTGISGSLSSSVTDFQNKFVGNALLFGAYDAPETVFYPNGKFNFYTNAPLTISNGTTGGSVTDLNGTRQTVVIDLYRFYFYYLTQATTMTKQLIDGTDYSLIEWQSRQFADYRELNDYCQDPVLGGNVLAGVKTLGVTVGWDPTQSDPSQAFITFGGAAFGTASTGVTGLAPTYTIPMEVYTNVTHVTNGILTTGFRYGVSPDTVNWSSCPVQVPSFAPIPTPGTAFPNGFEVAAGNNPRGRQIMIRSVWVAQGATAPKAVFNDLNVVDEITDNW